MRIRHKISFTAFFILVIGIIAYITIPFSRLEQIHVFRQDGAPDDKIGIFIDRLLVYNHYLYVYKGVSFNDLQCYSIDNEDRFYL